MFYLIFQLERKFQRAVDRTAATDLSGDEDAARRVSDLHNALSIFYNLSKDYDKAIDAIRAAIALNPEVYAWDESDFPDPINSPKLLF